MKYDENETVLNRELIDNGRGWMLEVRRYHNPETFRPDRSPVVMFPGYCMNSFILAYHPSGESMVHYMARAGYEVWTANLRGQGGTHRTHGTKRTTFSNLASVDIPAVMQHVLSTTLTDRDDVCAAGCSLGATFLYAYLAVNEETPVRSIMSLGGPLRWTKIHPLVRIAFGSRRVAKRIVLPGTRALAEKLLPVAMRVPSALSLYMNADRIDLSNAKVLTQTVDDPIPSLNVEISDWIKNRDLTVDNVNVTHAMSTITSPLLQICANRDGVVPLETAASASLAFGSSEITTVVAGNEDNWFAHADLFINDQASEIVFEPMVKWLDDLD